MKYTEKYTNKKNRIGTGFYIVVACCLLGIGSASWFALSNYSADNTPLVSEDNSEYKQNESSYNESESSIVEEQKPTEDVADQVSDQPYSSEESVTSEVPPVKSFTMPVQGEILKQHSADTLQFSSTYGDMRLHCGLDIACEKGTSISACSDGKVLSVELNTSYGNIVTIDHGDGIKVKYCAIDNIKIESDSTVKMGDIIGTSATIPAECSDKDHIHIEVIKDGKSVSPLEAMGLN